MTTIEDMPLYVTCDLRKSDYFLLEEMVNGNSKYIKESQTIIEKGVKWYEFKAFLHHYPSLVKSFNKKDLTWTGWSKFQDIEGEPEGRFIRRSYTKSTNTYKICDIKSRNARYLLNIEWIDKMFFNTPPKEGELGVLKKKYAPRDNQPTPAPTPKSKPQMATSHKKETIVEEIFTEWHSSHTSKLPKEIKLDNSELFKHKGCSAKIETRGKREYGHVYFNANDVGDLFKMDGLKQTLFDKASAFIEGKDFKIFGFGRSTKLKNTFLTHNGLIGLSFKVRNNPIAEKFGEWCMKVLYSAHIGTEEDRMWAASQCLGVSCAQTKKIITETMSGVLTGIYLLSVGKVEQHRDFINNNSELGNDNNIYKFGLSTNYANRLMQHQTSGHFGKDTKVIGFAIVVNDQLPSEEGLVKKLVSRLGTRVEYQNEDDAQAQTEVYCLDNESLDEVKDLYTKIHNKYIGSESEKLTELKAVMLKMENAKKEEDARREIKDLKAEQAMEKLKVEHERELFTREREQFSKDNKMRDEQLASQKTQFESALEIEKLKATILQMKLDTRK